MTDETKSETPHGSAHRLIAAIEQQVLGQNEVVEALLSAYTAGGHVLLEGLPGLGKTLLARTFAATLGVPIRRVQFTPDLMPADLLGTNVFDAHSQSFRLLRGPVFTQVLMADEINRTPPKTQAALLEAMEEGQVTIDGVSHRLPGGFFVIATQNPIELEGVYPLPEAQLDRFLMRIRLEMPVRDAELEIYRRFLAGTLNPATDAEAGKAPGVVTPATATALRRAAAEVHVAEELLDYLQRLAEAVRRSPHLELGISPRGALALLGAARSAALIEGRDFVLPDDLKRFLSACWGHRVLLSAESELEGHTVDSVLAGIVEAVEVPH
ncbi:MAG: MoxR family ATPase [Acidobacteriota bacterium]